MHILIDIDDNNTLLPKAVVLVQNLEQQLSAQHLFSKKLLKKLPGDICMQWELTTNITEVISGQLISRDGIHIKLFYRQVIRVNMPFGLTHLSNGFETRITGQFLDLHEHDVFLTPDEKIHLKGLGSSTWDFDVPITDLKTMVINISEQLRMDLDLK